MDPPRPHNQDPFGNCKSKISQLLEILNSAIVDIDQGSGLNNAWDQYNKTFPPWFDKLKSLQK